MNFLSKLTFCSVLMLFSHASQSEPDSHFYQSNNTEGLSTNIDSLRSQLLGDQQTIVISLPLPNGNLVNFTLKPDSVMADELAVKYPNIRTFAGVSQDNPADTGRFDITPNGFHGMFSYHGERVFVEPVRMVDNEQVTPQQPKAKKNSNVVSNQYNSYFGQDSRLLNQTTYKFHSPKKIVQPFTIAQYPQSNRANKVAKVSPVESKLKTYRLAISAAAEYTEFNGGSVDSAMAEIITLVNRLNEVYQHDLAIKLELVGNNDLLIFTDANADPFNNDDNDGELNKDVIDSVIGNDSYDIGHVVNTDGGGLAILGGVCDSSYKADGMTGDRTPNNDAFYIDYVAHEIGHQFGANHTFNGTVGACSGNRVPSSAYEVGSGSTIMGYAGICEGQNLQPHSDAFFHAHSIEQINRYIESGTGSRCGTTSEEVNNTAVVNAGLDYTIPARTPFMLSGSAVDSDSHNLSYSWQQFDLGTKSASLAEQVDDGSRPLFRAFLPTSEAVRYFPKLSDVLNNTMSIGESLPTTNRELNFRLMVFDDEGGASFDEVKLNVIDTSEEFSLNTPVLGDIWTANINNISWQVADTHLAPINCATVDILLSKDDGKSFAIRLAEGVPNSGSEDVSLGAFCAEEINTSKARLKLVCSDNVFYSINNGSFSINKSLSSTDIAITGQSSLSMVQGDSLTLISSQLTYACEAADTITVTDGEGYTFSGDTITANENFSGVLLVNAIASKNGINSEEYAVSITVEEKIAPEPIPEPSPDPTPEPTKKSSGSVFWLLLFVCILPWRVWLLQTKNS